ncbi:SDR family oxidoreductase [Candidatus Poribacteria bacterium]|nr:SDR family oxidoreductase [Candidatus Poribacteria bacterium]
MVPFLNNRFSLAKTRFVVAKFIAPLTCRNFLLPEDEKAIAESTPLGRVGRPEDVADVTVFLCSEQARWLIGQLFYVGGGYRIP